MAAVHTATMTFASRLAHGTGREQEDLVLFRPHFREVEAADLTPGYRRNVQDGAACSKDQITTMGREVTGTPIPSDYPIGLSGMLASAADAPKARGGSNMPIVALLQKAAFDPETTQTLTTAFDKGWEEFKSSGSALAAGSQ